MERYRPDLGHANEEIPALPTETWEDSQLSALLSRLPQAAETKEKAAALLQYESWVNEVRKKGFEGLTENLPPQTYYLFPKNGGRGVEVVHKRTWLRAVGKEEAEARQALEAALSAHILDWKDHQEAIAGLNGIVENMVSEIYTQ